MARLISQRCDGVTRRTCLQLGTLGALGLTLPDWLQCRARAARDNGRAASARACILIWLDGGPSHLETFDPKPNAPREVRGPFPSIATAVPGIQICELLPQTAQRIRDVALVRSVTSPLGEHDFATHYLLTGYKPTPVLNYPSFGSVVAHLKVDQSPLPRHIAVPDFRVGGGRLQSEGYLPAECAPLQIHADPAKPGFRVADLEFYPGVGRDRIDRRRQFVQALDAFQAEHEEATRHPDNPQLEQAYRLVTSPQAKRAFNLAEEPVATRQRYGSRTIGQSCLLARRLIQHGVAFVTVNYPGWDTHQDAYTRLKEGFTAAQVPVGLIPSLDLALAALLDDLRQLQLLDETLVVVMGEFGRTPKLNTAGGRDHWPRVFSVALAGGGIAGGQVIGSSDAHGESPKDRPVTPADLAATIYTLLGIDPQQNLLTNDGRPVAISRDGKVIEELIA